MGMPSKTSIESQTDRIARALALNLAGLRTETGAGTVGTLASLVDAVGDPYYEAALLGVSNAFDVQSLPANLKDALPALFGRAGYRDWVNAWERFMLSADGGSQGSIRAYLDGLGAQVDPLFGELVRHVKSESVFTDSNGVVQCVAAPNYTSRAPDRVYTGADGSLVDDTTDVGDADTADVALFAADDDTLYIGSDYKFCRIVIGLSTAASATITPSFQYWNGTSWGTLTVTDNSVGCTVNDVISFTAPSDWARCKADAGGTDFADVTPRYYVRMARTANSLATPPVATCIRIVPLPVLNGSGAHLGVDQPPLALVRITGASTAVVDTAFGGSGATALALAHLRFRPQPIRFRALTPELGTPTLTPAYTDQDGNAASQAQSALSSPAALDTIAITLAGGDTGVRSITGMTVSGGAQGVLEIYVPALRTPSL